MESFSWRPRYNCAGMQELIPCSTPGVLSNLGKMQTRASTGVHNRADYREYTEREFTDDNSLQITSQSQS